MPNSVRHLAKTLKRVQGDSVDDETPKQVRGDAMFGWRAKRLHHPHRHKQNTFSPSPDIGKKWGIFPRTFSPVGAEFRLG
jgi:hypothetical protein